MTRIREIPTDTTDWWPGFEKLQLIQQIGDQDSRNCNWYNRLVTRIREIPTDTTDWWPGFEKSQLIQQIGDRDSRNCNWYNRLVTRIREIATDTTDWQRYQQRTKNHAETIIGSTNWQVLLNYKNEGFLKCMLEFLKQQEIGKEKIWEPTSRSLRKASKRTRAIRKKVFKITGNFLKKRKWSR